MRRRNRRSTKATDRIRTVVWIPHPPSKSKRRCSLKRCSLMRSFRCLNDTGPCLPWGTKATRRASLPWLKVPPNNIFWNRLFEPFVTGNIFFLIRIEVQQRSVPSRSGVRFRASAEPGLHPSTDWTIGTDRGERNGATRMCRSSWSHRARQLQGHSGTVRQRRKAGGQGELRSCAGHVRVRKQPRIPVRRRARKDRIVMLLPILCIPVVIYIHGIFGIFSFKVFFFCLTSNTVNVKSRENWIRFKEEKYFTTITVLQILFFNGSWQLTTGDQ